MKDKIVIIAAGDDFDISKIKLHIEECNYLIAVDGGLNIVDKMNLNPDLIIGDLDSVNPGLIEKYKYTEKEIFPKDKNFTDMELGIKKAISLFPKSITILSGTGSYIDHSLANIYLLYKYSSNDFEIKIVTSNSMIFIINKTTSLKKFKDRRFSLFPLLPIKSLRLKGVKYNFTKSNLSRLDYSISNVIVSDNCLIDFKKGVFLCIIFDQGYK